MCDIYIEVKKKNWKGDKVVARANINLNFIEKTKDGCFWEMRKDEVRVSKSLQENFAIKFTFQEYCSCHLKPKPDCMCEYDRNVEQKCWDQVLSLASISLKIPIEEACKILFQSSIKSD